MASTQIQTPGIPPHQLSSTLNQSRLQGSESQPVHDVNTTLNYYKDPPDGGPPPPNIVNKPETYDRPVDTRPVLVHDIRGTEDQYTLDTKGFQIYNHQSVEKDFVDDEQIKRVYYPETERLLKEATGASKIFIFDHTVRRQTNDKSENGTTKQTLRGPVQRVHIDQSYKAGPQRVTHHLPDEADRLLKGRYQIINVWRPIKPIFKDPLGVADATSVPDSDLLPVQLIYPDRVGETFTVRANEQHQWYYLYGQRPDEVTLIKCFDSKTDGRARRVPHSAFVNPATEAEEPRESIEVRALVFHPDDTD
ncbi:hypothetical protein MMC07_005384 [Pseudocyphellaria aurata]|nr:hypothetical protein [Pseudocyphellaria aurata]